MYCPSCGSQNVDFAQFCLTCGAPFPQQPPLKQAPAPKLGDNQAMRMLLPVGKAPLAIAAGWVGLLSPLCCPLLGPIAIVLGIMAIIDLKRHKEKRGMGRAVFGVIAGGIACLMILFYFVKLAH